MRKKIYIEGMHCASCEVLIERRLKNVAGVDKVRVSHTSGEVELDCSFEPKLKDLGRAIKRDGYRIVQDKSVTYKNTVIDYVQIGAIFLILVAAYFTLNHSGLTPHIGVSQNMSYGLIFVLGLIAATSTCLAVTGGLLIAISARYSEAHPNLTRAQTFKPHIYFNIGRVLSYTLFGALLGFIGSLFVFSSQISGIITIVVSVFMIFLGLQMLHLIPGLNRLQIKVPKFIAHRIYEKGSQEYKPTAPVLLGVLTFFLPCGFTQALQLYVLTTGSPIVGGLTMLAFSLGTLPGLLSLGALSSFTKGTAQKYFVRVAAVLVILLGVFSIFSGLNLVGIDVNSASHTTAQSQTFSTNMENGEQVVHMRVDGATYTPHRFTVLQGVPVRWEIDGRNAEGCAQVITIPKLGKTESLPKDSIKVIEFTPKNTGTISFSCTMGMTTPGSAFDVIAASQ